MIQVTEDDDFPWIWVYLAIMFAIIVSLCAFGCYIALCRKKRKIEPTTKPEPQITQVQHADFTTGPMNV